MTRSVAEDRADAYGRRLAVAGGTVAKRELRAAEGLDNNQASRAAGLLTERGLAVVSGRGGSVLTLTEKGWARYRPLLPGATAGAVLDRALDGWPARLAAMAQLIAFAVLARPISDGAPRCGFALIGDSETGKSSAVRLVAALFGLDSDLTLIDTPKLTDRPTGRLERNRHHADGESAWSFVPAAWTSYPLVCFDEWAEISSDARADLRGSALSTSGATTYEGMRVEISPVPVLAGNPDTSLTGVERVRAVLGLKDTIRRRCIVLDTGHTTDLDPETLDHIGTAADRLPASDRLPLSGLPIAPGPDAETIATLNAYLDAALTPEGRAFTPKARSLEPLVRACHALQPHGTPSPVATATVLAAVLTVCDSVPGQTNPAWRSSLTHWADQAATDGHSSAGQVARAVRAAEQAAAQQARDMSASRVARVKVADEIAHAATQLAERCSAAAGRLDGRTLTARGATSEQKIRAAALRKTLRRLAQSAGQAATRSGLDEQHERATRWLADAEELAAQVESAHHERVQQQRQARQDAQDTKRQAAEYRRRERQRVKDAARAARAAQREARANLRHELTRLRATLRGLEKLWAMPDGATAPDPLQTLTTAVPSPLVEYRPHTPSLESRGLLERLADRMAPPGVWVTTYPGGSLRAAGWPTRCPDLASWGPATRSVLAPVLHEGHAREDQLCEQLGTAPRHRPALLRPPVPVGVARRALSIGHR